MAIHCVATGPVTSSAVSATLRPCVTTWQKSAASPRTHSVSLGSFHSQISPEGATSRTYGGGPGISSFRFTKVQPKVFIPMVAMFLMRSV